MGKPEEAAELLVNLDQIWDPIFRTHKGTEELGEEVFGLGILVRAEEGGMEWRAAGRGDSTL
jgi:hypothetical protein